MKVIVDTNVWSEAFRKGGEGRSPEVAELEELIREGRVQMLGPVRVEVLCGIREEARSRLLERRLSAFPDRTLETPVYTRAAGLFNRLRSRGIQGSTTDCILCACSLEWDLPILTQDQDFKHFRKHVPIRLHPPRAELK